MIYSLQRWLPGVIRSELLLPEVRCLVPPPTWERRVPRPNRPANRGSAAAAAAATQLGLDSPARIWVPGWRRRSRRTGQLSWLSDAVRSSPSSWRSTDRTTGSATTSFSHSASVRRKLTQWGIQSFGIEEPNGKGWGLGRGLCPLCKIFFWKFYAEK